MSEDFGLPPWLRRWLAQRLAQPAVPAPHQRVRRVCIYKVDRIGDFALATGALRMLVDHFGAAHCRLVVSTDAAPLAAAEFPELERWVAPAEAGGVWREIRPLRARLARTWAAERFDELVCLRHARSLYRDVTLSWLHARDWHGLDARPGAEDLTLANRPELPASYPRAAQAPWCRELAAHRAVLAHVLGREPGWEELRPRLNHLRAEAGREVVLCPFGGEPIRDYAGAAWLAAWRASFPAGTAVRVLGSAARREELEDLAAGLRAAGADSIAETSVPPLEFVRCIARARLVLTVESAAAHLATALDKPAVAVIGGGHFGWFAPWGDGRRQRWVHHPLDCFGCNWECRQPRVECLADLPSGAVATAIQEVLTNE